MNIDLAVILCLADEKENQPFDEYVAKMVDNLLAKNPEERAFLSRYDIHYYIADNPNDKSIARVVDADYSDDMLLKNGRRFAVVFNRDMLSQLKNEDSMAFVVGHELSHIMYQKGFPRVRNLDLDEEVACDCSSIRLMHSSDYNILDVAAVDMLYSDISLDMRERIIKRDTFMAKEGIYPADRMGMSRVLNKEIFVNLHKKPWKRDSIFEKQEPDVSQIVEELGDIFERGDRTDFKRELNDFLSKKTSEESSKMIMSILGRVMTDFPSIMETRAKNGCRRYYNHPVSVMSDIVWEQFGRSGQKLLPPNDLIIVNRYVENNREYFEQREQKLWSPMLNCIQQMSSIKEKNSGRN